uniref:PssD/Cps14F family polysaccharide biosynthesis glycosyltransferase n=1 Tax=Vibrio jasicida TaxID=766224 RepID=UPI000CE3016F
FGFFMKKISIVFGCGGHRAQASRFYQIFSADGDTEFYGITDEGDSPDWCKSFLVLEHFRDKYSGRLVSPIKFISNVRKAYKFLRDNNISTVVSFGPGVAIFVGVAAKLTGCSIIHFETWSKFYSPTITTKVMKYLTKNIFIQNAELIDAIPYGQYVGRF